MSNNITPPPELVKRWFDGNGTYEDDIRQAVQWGADRELEACCQWLQVRINEGWNACHLEDLRAARRPKPSSLKEQALKDFDELLLAARQAGVFNPPDNILRALEALPND